MHRLLACAIVVSVAWIGISLGQSQPAQEQKSAATSAAGSRPVIVELFTSEGCSSCPPADDFVRKLDTVQPVAGVQLIVLSEHVDYWDHEGWKDPNSSAALTERQTDYKRSLGLGGPYTPQLIVDGAKELRLDDPKQFDPTFQQAAATPKVGIRIGQVTIDPGTSLLRTHVDADESADKHADVFVAVALDHVESQVSKGENGGRRLTHVAVVQQIDKVGRLQKGKSFAEDIQVKLKPGTDPKNIRLVAFVQTPGPGKMLGAAMWKAER